MIETHPSVSEIIRAEGYLYVSPSTTLDIEDQATWGTKLGFSNEASVLAPAMAPVLLTQEETGLEVRKVILGGSSPVFTCILRNYNSQTLAAAFPNMTSSETVTFPKHVSAGRNLLLDAKVFLYIPNDYENTPSIKIYLGIPRLQNSGYISLSHSDQILFALYINCLRQSETNATAVKIDLLENF